MAFERTQSSPGSREVDPRLEKLTLLDLEAVRNLLRGGSVIDWHRLAFRDLADVDRFLRVNEFDPTHVHDLQRMEVIREEAVEYLTRNFGFRIPAEIAHELPVRELFLAASGKGKRQVYACVVLKVMHIIHHLAGRELLFRLPVSDDEVFHLVERKVVRTVEEIRAAGHPIVLFEWSRKPRDSLITKLLAKRSTSAASVYDKLRFRLVVRDREDILPLLVELQHRLIPFNYVVPDESVNDLLSFRRILETPPLSALASQLQLDVGVDDTESENPTPNEFSGPGYRIINFVADLPIRIDDFICRVGDPGNLEFGAIAFVLTEFQVVDSVQARVNDTGENSHEKYKERQHARVRARLLRGMHDRAPTMPPESEVVPTPRAKPEGEGGA